MSDPAPPTPKRPLWANLVIGVYGLLTTALLLGPPAVALSSGDGGSILATAGFAVVLFGCGASLFVIPVPKGNRERVVARRTIWLPIIVSSLLAALVCLGFTVALHEFLFGNRDGFIAGVNSGYLVIFAVLAVWVGWLTLFGGMALSRGPESIGDRLWQALLVGSAAELLVAVPMHLVVRNRGYCCVGMMTGLGIGLGVIVLVAAMGPAVFVLCHRRYRQVYSRKRPYDSE